MLLICLILLLAAHTAYAIQGIGISPTSEDLSLDPGQTSSGQMTVINDGDTNVSYQIYATDYSVANGSYKSSFLNSGSGADISPVSWFVFPKGTFAISARQESTFNYEIRVPKTAAVGGHYGTLFIQTVPPPQTGTYISRVERIGSIFYLAVGGNLNRAGKFLGLNVPFLQWSSPIKGQAIIQNSGNTHFPVNIEAQLYSPFGKEGLPATTRGEVLPGTVRNFQLLVPATAAIGLYKVAVTETYLGKAIHQASWVLLVPMLTFVLVIIAIALIVIAGIWSGVRKHRKKKASEQASLA